MKLQLQMLGSLFFVMHLNAVKDNIDFKSIKIKQSISSSENENFTFDQIYSGDQKVKNDLLSKDGKNSTNPLAKKAKKTYDIA